MIIESARVNSEKSAISIALRRSDGVLFNGSIIVVERRGILVLQGIEDILEEMGERSFDVILLKLMFRVLGGEVLEFPYELTH